MNQGNCRDADAHRATATSEPAHTRNVMGRSPRFLHQAKYVGSFPVERFSDYCRRVRARLNEHHRLRTGYIKTFAAGPADQHVVDAHHVVA